VSEDYVTAPHQEPSPTDAEAQQHDSYGPDAGSDDDDSDDGHEDSEPESFDALESRFHGLEEEVATLVADVHDLALYTKLNITGFMKILKVCFLWLFHPPMSNYRASLQKHDVHSRTYSALRTINNSLVFRNKQTCHSKQHSFRTTSNDVPSTSTTGMPLSSSFPSFTTWFALVDIRCRVTPVLGAARVRL
jgi:SPX domain protein involved in polyphosphate accumulation